MTATSQHALDINIENAGLDVLLEGVRYPIFAENSLFKRLGAALSLEQTSRKNNDTARKPVELPGLETLSDTELRQAAGFLYGLCCQVDVERYPKTFAFCFALIAVLLDEINLRSPVPAGVTVH